MERYIMGLFDKFKKNSKNVKKENEKINTSRGNLFDEKPKDALTNNMNFDEKLGTYVIEIKGIIFESGTEQGDTYISSLDKIADNYYNALNGIVKFMMPDLELTYGKLDEELIREKLGKPTIDYDNGTVKYLEQSFDGFHIFEFEFLDDEFTDIQYFSIDG